MFLLCTDGEADPLERLARLMANIEQARHVYDWGARSSPEPRADPAPDFLEFPMATVARRAPAATCAYRPVVGIVFLPNISFDGYADDLVLQLPDRLRKYAPEREGAHRITGCESYYTHTRVTVDNVLPYTAGLVDDDFPAPIARRIIKNVYPSLPSPVGQGVLFTWHIMPVTSLYIMRNTGEERLNALVASVFVDPSRAPRPTPLPPQYGQLSAEFWGVNPPAVRPTFTRADHATGLALVLHDKRLYITRGGIPIKAAADDGFGACWSETIQPRLVRAPVDVNVPCADKCSHCDTPLWGDIYKSRVGYTYCRWCLYARIGQIIGTRPNQRVVVTVTDHPRRTQQDAVAAMKLTSDVAPLLAATDIEHHWVYVGGVRRVYLQSEAEGWRLGFVPGWAVGAWQLTDCRLVPPCPHLIDPAFSLDPVEYVPCPFPIRCLN
jgi:hypothetical protein